MKPFINSIGDVISAGLSMEPPQARSMIFKDFRLMQGQITAVYAVDSENNSSQNAKGTFTVYDVIVYHPDGSTEQLQRAIALQPLFGGGFNNFMEVLPQTPGQKALDFSIAPSIKPGSYVLVAFIDGIRADPIILGTIPHPNQIAVAERPIAQEQPTIKGEFQGLQWQINNDGSLSVVFNGPRDDQGNFLGTNGPTILSIDSNGNFTVTTNNNQSVFVDRVNKVIDVVNGETEIKMEQDSKTITVNCDLLVANVKKDATVTTMGKTTVNSSKDVVVSSDSAIKLQKGKDGSPSEPYILGQKFKSFMGELLDNISQIMSIGNLGAPAPLSPDVIAKFTAMKPKVDQLLSELIKGM